MLDLQRNLLTTLLVASIGVIVLAGSAVALLMGRPDVAAIEPQGNTDAPDARVDAPETGLQEFSAYSEIVERPVFFSDRQLPVVEAPGEPDEAVVEEESEAEEVEDLEAEIAGIVITPEMKLAMVSDKQAKKTMVLREGMSLEGDQAAWKLDVIEPRRVNFVSVDGRETALELKVNTEGLASASTGGERSREPADENQQEPDQEAQATAQREASEEARARAEEIRRRVAERRAQLRAEAERRAQQRQQQDNDG